MRRKDAKGDTERESGGEREHQKEGYRERGVSANAERKCPGYPIINLIETPCERGRQSG